MSVALLAFVCGCNSYNVVQTNIFSDEDGRVARVDYGRALEPHVNTFMNPATGKEVEFSSRLVVEVDVADRYSFTAWQCMNFLRTGTMYKSDNGKWMFLANGFTCFVYERQKDGNYLEVYRGVLCESPKSQGDGGKWRDMKKDAAGRWR
jgi:hypothetical protein